MTIFATGIIRNYQIIVGGTKMLAVPIVWVILWMGGSPLTGILVNIGLELICLAERLIFTKKATDLSPFVYLSKTVGRCWTVFGIAFLISLLIKFFFDFSIFLMIPVSLLITVSVIALLGLSSSERILIINMIRSKIMRK